VVETKLGRAGPREEADLEDEGALMVYCIQPMPMRERAGSVAPQLRTARGEVELAEGACAPQVTQTDGTALWNQFC